MTSPVALVVAASSAAFNSLGRRQSSPATRRGFGRLRRIHLAPAEHETKAQRQPHVQPALCHIGGGLKGDGRIGLEPSGQGATVTAQHDVERLSFSGYGKSVIDNCNRTGYLQSSGEIM